MPTYGRKVRNNLINAAATAFSALARYAPDAAYKLYRGSFERTITNAEYKRLGVRFADPSKPGDRGSFVDPYTGRDTMLIVEDQAVVDTRFEDFGSITITAADGTPLLATATSACASAATFHIHYDNLGEYSTVVYRSSASGKPVRLPEGWQEE